MSIVSPKAPVSTAHRGFFICAGKLTFPMLDEYYLSAISQRKIEANTPQ